MPSPVPPPRSGGHGLVRAPRGDCRGPAATSLRGPPGPCMPDPAPHMPDAEVPLLLTGMLSLVPAPTLAPPWRY